MNFATFEILRAGHVVPVMVDPVDDTVGIVVEDTTCWDAAGREIIGLLFFEGQEVPLINSEQKEASKLLTEANHYEPDHDDAPRYLSAREQDRITDAYFARL